MIQQVLWTMWLKSLHDWTSWLRIAEFIAHTTCLSDFRDRDRGDVEPDLLLVVTQTADGGHACLLLIRDPELLIEQMVKQRGHVMNGRALGSIEEQRELGVQLPEIS